MPPAGASRCCPVPDLRTKDPLLKQRNGSLSSPARAGTPTVDCPICRLYVQIETHPLIKKRYGVSVSILEGGGRLGLKCLLLSYFRGGDYSGVASVCATPECQVSYAVDIATEREPPAVELPERDANRCILVRGGKPVFVLLCDAEEMLHLLRSWGCGGTVRIEWPCELAEEAVEFLLAHNN